MNYSDIFTNWQNLPNDSITDGHINTLKSNVYELIPEWTGNKLIVVPHQINNEYLVSNYNCKQTIIYNIIHNTYKFENKNFIDLLPDVQTVFSGFKQTELGYYLIFGRITGLHFLYLKYQSSVNECIYDSEESCIKSIKMIEENKTFEPIDNTLAKKLLKYSFAGDENIENRYDQWYSGKWKEYTALGIKSNSQTSEWHNNLGQEVTIEKYAENELLSYEEFIKLIFVQ